MDNTYIFSMQAHLAALQSGLHGLTEIIEQRDFTRYEYRAAGRTLQVFIEVCKALPNIGIMRCLNWRSCKPVSMARCFCRIIRPSGLNTLINLKPEA